MTATSEPESLAARPIPHGIPVEQHPTQAAIEAQRPGLAGLAMLFLWLGSVSIGGRALNFVFDELVQRRGWLSEADYLEGFTLARLLPGSTAVSASLFYATTLRGLGGGVLLMAAFVLPGGVLALALTLLVFNVPRSPWLEGALAGCSGAAIGLIIAQALKVLNGVRAARLWPLTMGLAFLGYGLLGAPLMPTLVASFSASLLMNLPSRRPTR